MDELFGYKVKSKPKLISLVKEKKATSQPEVRADNTRKIRIKIISFSPID